jgi:UrcA family protein
MRKMLITTLGAVVAAVIAGDVLAQNESMPEVIVQASRLVSTTMVSKSSSGIPIDQVSMGYTVTAQGLDIGTPIGAHAFETRLTDAAVVACRELGRRYPNSGTSDAECVQEASNKAIAKARQLEDAAAAPKT